MEDDELVRVLGQSIVAATTAIKNGKPQAGLDMIDIVLGALPASGLEAVELAALPTKAIALARIGRADEARQVLVRMEQLAASHGTDNDRLACKVVREQVDLGPPALAVRAKTATEAVQRGEPDGLVELEAIAREALEDRHHVLAFGCLVFLGKVYAAVENPELARDRLTRARTLLETSRPLDDARHAAALADIDALLAAL